MEIIKTNNNIFRDVLIYWPCLNYI